MRWGILAAIGIYFAWGVLLIAQKPGLQYDEGLLVDAAVHMLHPKEEFTLSQAPHIWVCLFKHCIPLMGGGERYVGAIKDYLALPLFAIFGPRTAIIRLLALFLGAVGIWGISELIASQVSSPTALAVALALAINPAYVNMIVFDNNAFSGMMAAFGLVCAALAGYLGRRTTFAAFLLGVAMGFGVWTRANFLWILAAGGFAALIIFRRRLLSPVSHWIAIASGGILGGFPFLLYQAVSKGGTFAALRIFSTPLPLAQLIPYRFLLFQDMLLSDGEHRKMWGAVRLPAWQMWTFPIVIAAACVVCLGMRGDKDPSRQNAARFSTLTFLSLGAYLFISRLEVAEHHLIALLPIAIVVVVLACSILQARFRSSRLISAGLALIYLGSAIYWQVASIQGLRKTGGIGMWSDAVVSLGREIDRDYRDREIKILDWGLQANLYTVMDGRLKSREIYPGASSVMSSRNRPWIDEIREGGVFLLNGPDYREFPAPSEGFLEALQKARPMMHWHSIQQRNGETYAQLIEIEPNSFQGAPAADALPTTISMSDPRFESLSTGFYSIEADGSRWTKREFSLTFGEPEPRGDDAKFSMRLFIPDVSIQKLGPMTLHARIGSQELAPETYSRSGLYAFKRDLNAAWIMPGPIRIVFTLDKALPPSAADARELGIVVLDASVAHR